MKYLCSFILIFIIMIIIIVISCNEIIVITVFRRDKLFNLALFTIIVILLLFIFVFFSSAIFYERNYNSTYLSFLRCTFFYLPILQSVIYAMLIKAPSKSWWLCKCSLNCFYLSP